MWIWEMRVKEVSRKISWEKVLSLRMYWNDWGWCSLSQSLQKEEPLWWRGWVGGRQEILEDSGYFEFEMQQDVQLVMSLSSWIYGFGTKERSWGWRYRTGSHCCRGGVWRRLLMRWEGKDLGRHNSLDWVRGRRVDRGLRRGGQRT